MRKTRPDTSIKSNSPGQITEPLIQVLYIDDEPELLEIGKRFLEKTGSFSVTVLSSAGEGLITLKGHSFDVIVSDYQMPQMDGIIFLKELRHLGDQTPFILFTGQGREEVAVEAYEHGADHYVQKGGSPSAQFADLAHKIRRCVEKHRIEEKNRSLTRCLHFIRQVNRAFAQSQDLDELLVMFCELAILYGTFELCWIGFTDLKENMVIPSIIRSSSDQWPDSPGIKLFDSEEGRGDDPCGNALIRGSPYTCNDTRHLQNNPKWSEWAQAKGYCSFCSVPLMGYDHLIGAFTIFSKQSGFFDIDRIEMLTDIGANIAFALSAFERGTPRHGIERAVTTNESRHETPDMDHLLDRIEPAADGILLNNKEEMVLNRNSSMGRIADLSKDQAQRQKPGGVRGSLSADNTGNDQGKRQQIEQMHMNGPITRPEVPRKSTLIVAGRAVKQIKTVRSMVPTDEGFKLQGIAHKHFSQSITGTGERASDSPYPAQARDHLEVTRHNLINQLTALNSYTGLLIEENRERDPTSQYLEKIREISLAIQNEIYWIRDPHRIKSKTRFS